MKKFCLAALTVFLYGVITAQGTVEKCSGLPVKKIHYYINISADNKPFAFHSPVYEYFTDKLSIDYLQKSKNQKTWAWIIASGGAIAILAAFAHDLNNILTDANSLTGLYIAGGAMVGVGVILFSAAAKNKRKANTTSVSIKKEQVPGQRINICNHSFPALESRVPL
ncbi:MAG TPA: hypothetical protein VJ765_11440 [Chitinophagaceae bacterium]|nr:hypothetical protein [Chitinophagaceae bacterium]